MLQSFLNLEGVAVLNKEEQSKVNGADCGFVVGYYDQEGNLNTYAVYSDQYSKEDVHNYIAFAFENGYSDARWCCASCDEASCL